MTRSLKRKGGRGCGGYCGTVHGISGGPGSVNDGRFWDLGLTAVKLALGSANDSKNNWNGEKTHLCDSNGYNGAWPTKMIQIALVNIRTFHSLDLLVLHFNQLL
jgi:hypothetical protein